MIGQASIKTNFVIEKTSPTLHLKGSNGIINFNSGDVTLTNTSNALTIVGGVLALPANGLLINSINHLYGLTDTITDLYYTKTIINAYLAGKQDTGVISMTYPASGIALSTGSAWGTSITNNSASWNTAYTDRLKWDGGSTDLVAATGRTSLGGTTVGQAFFTLTNPSAIRVPIIQTNNTITATATTGTGNVVLSASPTFTGTVAGITSTMVGLGNLTNKLQVEVEDSTGIYIGNYMPRVSTANLVKDSLDARIGDGVDIGDIAVLKADSTGGAGHYASWNDMTTGLAARSMIYSDTMSVSAGVLRTKATTITTEPYSVQIFTSGGKDITHAVSDSVALNGGVYKLYVYSVDELTGCKLKILY